MVYEKSRKENWNGIFSQSVCVFLVRINDFFLSAGLLLLLPISSPIVTYSMLPNKITIFGLPKQCKIWKF